MALTDAEKQELLNEIKASSNDVSELETVTSLDGIVSLPAMRGEELVNAPIALLRKPAEEAATVAKNAANEATAAAGQAEKAKNAANTSADVAYSAATSANSAADHAAEAASNANTAALNYESTALAARNGATARFDAVIEKATVASLTSILDGGRIVYVRSAKKFAYEINGTYCNDAYVDGVYLMNMYMDQSRIAVLKDKVYLCGAIMYVWSDEENDLVEASGSGSGSGFYNLTIEQPLANGYYTLETAIAALANADIDDDAKLGMIITFEVSAGKWVDYRFCASSIDNFLTVASWEEYGGGKIKQIIVNGQSIIPDAEGKVNIVIDEQEVDETLDASSTNPVQNSTITAKFNEVDAATVFDMSAEVSDDESTVRLALKNKSGAEIAAVDIPAGSGGGGGDASTTKIVLNASVDNPIIKEGGSAKLTYTFDHQYSSGDDKGVSTGQKATISIQMLRGSTTTYSNTIQEVSKGSYDLDISKYLFAGTTDIYVKATTIDPTTGKTQTKQSYISVKVVTLSLSSSYNLANSIAGGGYGASETVGIPYAVSGSGTKVITLYVDGRQHNTATVTRSGTTNGSFNLSMSGLSVGRHTVQMVAEMEASADLTLRSESVYIDIFKAGSNVPLVGTMHSFKDGRIFTNDHLAPRLEVGQYEELSFDFVVYNPDATPASMVIFRNGAITQGVSVPRSTQVYSNRFTEQGENAMKFVCGITEYPFYIDVVESGIDINETTYGLKIKLDATGRSNEEDNPGTWQAGDVETVFEKTDFKTSGWFDGVLKLINGAKATIGYRPFLTDISATGATFEFEFRVSNVVDREASVISCMDGNKGFKITAEEASMLTGSTKVVETEDGTLETPVGVSMKFAPDMWLKVAFVVGKRSDGRLMELYINGIRSKADIYGAGDYFSQDTPMPITIDSDKADVEIRNIRIYDRAISDDEELSNHIIDRKTVEEMSELIQANDVLDDDTGEVSIDKLLAKGKGAILFVRANGLDEINATNNKDQNFLCDFVIIYTPWGDVIEIRNCYVRIQGTSSTKYPRKNYRIYCAKGSNPEVWINGVKQSGNKVSVMPGDIPVKVLCPKCDYSDSSMTHNTGMAKLFNDVMKELGLLTPPQEIDSNIRSTINGYPVDVFSAETIDGERTYYGQYNLNNDKSDWADLTGMNPVVGADGNEVEWECPISLEFLNNSYALDKFQLYATTDAGVDAELDAGFDDALEFNFPKDVYWTSEKAAKKEGTAATAKQKAAYKRLITWIRDCVPANADMTCKDLSTWKSDKFKNEVSQYFHLAYLLTYYIITDYGANVDQRVKNMIMRTWNGLLWFITFYDGDTALLLRNDCFLAYLYTLNRETYDAEKGGYAFEGFDSWLWCLVLANMETELKACASNLRQVLTNTRVLDMYNKEQAGNWCERIYNKSGKLKYIDPQIDGVEVNGSIVTYPYIYALQGSREAHRTHTITNRFALLDARYETGNYTSDNIDLYMSRTATDGTTMMVVVANEVYYFGYGTNNTPSIQASQKAEKGESVTLTFTDAFSLNDPMRVYGASRIRELRTSTAGNQFVGNINLNKCTALQILDMSTSGSGGDFYMNLDNCRQLTEINLNGQAKVRTGSQASTELDFTSQTRLRVLYARGTSVKSIQLAKGAPLEAVIFPSSLTTLRLEYLPNLQMGGLTIVGYSNVETFIFAGCPGLNWQTLLGRCTNVVRIRVEGLSIEGDGSLLNTYLNKKGVDAEGNAVDTCSLVGTYTLTRYPSDEELETWRTHYPELNIILPEHTAISFDDSVSDGENITNLDNLTGYAYGNTYEASGHITRILNKRHRCVAKKTGAGEVTICQLHDKNSNYYADADNFLSATPADLTGGDGNVFMFEPHYWYKGVNDHLNKKKYAFFSSNESCPPKAESVKILFEELSVKKGYAVRSSVDYTTRTEAETVMSSDSVVTVDVQGYKQVRYPSLPSALYGAIFVDADGNVVKRMKATSDSGILDGMYCFTDIPEGAVSLVFTIATAAPFDYVLLTKSDKIEAIEPDWVEHEECLVGVYEAYLKDDSLYSISGVGSTGSVSQADFRVYARNRGTGFQLVDWEMHKDIGNLFFAKYGGRDSQGICGPGTHTNGRTMGASNATGMQDTTANADGSWYKQTLSSDGSSYPNGNAYVLKNEGDETRTAISTPVVLGYENWHGNKAEWMDNVGFCTNAVDYKWDIGLPDGTKRELQGLKTSGNLYQVCVIHGRYMDTIAALAGGSVSSHYHDYTYQSGTKGRVVYRSSSHASSYGGVSYAIANSDSSNTYTSIGSRLAFRGKIVVARSVAAYKAIVEIS